ncbi:MAG: TonB family protein [Bacteroidota bacterium]|nr:TonB family protein [Bacteroidota bacterium]
MQPIKLSDILSTNFWLLLNVIILMGIFSCTTTEASLADKKNYTEDNKELRNKFDYIMEEGEKPLRYGYYYVVSTLPGGYKVRVYHPDKKTLIEEKTYSTPALTLLHGFYKSYWDDGSIHEQGSYQFGRKHGIWLEAEPGKGKSSSGEYQNQRKEGLWTQLDSNGMVESVYYWHDGKKHGKYFLYDAAGEKVNEGLYKNDTLIAELFKQPVTIKPYLKNCESNQVLDVYTCTDNTLNLLLSNELRYPAKAKQLGMEGKAMVQYEVEADGSVRNIRVPLSISDEIEAEIMRVVQKIPPYRPATMDGVPVKYTISLPLNFGL